MSFGKMMKNKDRGDGNISFSYLVPLPCFNAVKRQSPNYYTTAGQQLSRRKSHKIIQKCGSRFVNYSGIDLLAFLWYTIITEGRDKTKQPERTDNSR